MAHKAQMEYVLRLRKRFPDWFCNQTVLEVGSLNINGSVRWFFTDCDYWGIDIGPGQDVDQSIHVVEFQTEKKYDVVISCEALEHDQRWELSLQKMMELLKPGGVLILTCGGEGRPEHGTTRTTPANSPYTTDHYRNLAELDIRPVLEKSGANWIEFDFAPEDTRLVAQKGA